MSLWPALACFALSVLTPVCWVPALRRWGVVDIPNLRSSHVIPTIRGAGLAPATGVLGALLLTVPLFGARPAVLLAVLLAGVLVLAALGLVEDVRGLGIGVRVAGQLGVGVLLAVVLCSAASRTLWWCPLLAFAIAAYVNVANFMDGVDGMSALHGILAGAYFVLVGLRLDQPALTSVALVTGAAFAGFAPWNLLRGRVFLGDVGSYLLGGLVVACVALTFLSGRGLLLAVAPTLPYLADTASTLLARAARGEQVLQSHRSHVYQRLTDVGWSHLGSATAVAAASAVCCAAAWWQTGTVAATVVCWLVVATTLALYLNAPRWASLRWRAAV